MKNNWVEEIHFFLGVIVICVLVLLPICGMAVLIDTLVEKAQCAELQKLMPDLEIKWQGLLAGCRVKTDSGLWIDSDNLYLIEAEGGE